jgi:uncharacterized protein (UPF0548 family)
MCRESLLRWPPLCGTVSSMFFFRRPTDDQIRELLARLTREPFSYDCVGCTRDLSIRRRSWNVDHARVLLGHGEEIFVAAREAIEAWAMFPSEITAVRFPERPREGLIVAVLYWAAPFRLWLVCPARVLYTIDESIQRDGHAIERFCFAYGTLPGHPERGEERFLVEWDKRDDSVWYDLAAVSQAAHWLIRLGYPYARHEQSRFRRLSCRAMQNALCRRGATG